MAEAGVDLQTNTGRFFCHKCNEELTHVLEDFTCPRCKSGFVEKLSDVPSNPTPATGSGGGPGHGMNHFQDGTMPFFELLRGFTRDMEVNVSTPPGQGSRSTAGSGSGARSPDMNFSLVMDVRAPNQASGGGGGSSSHPNTGHNAQPPINPMENMLFSFLNDLIAGLSGGGVTVGGGFPMIANLGDYVWGRDGLDAIVTQLMNQMEGTGPPPMPTDKLDRLPTVKISQEQVDRKLQCSVCWDDFKLHEDVKQLECDHVFHPDCIVPWLRLHATCPVCRKEFTNPENASAVPSARFEPPDNSRNGDNSGNSRGPTGSSGTSSGRGNNDLDRMDYDFD